MNWYLQNGKDSDIVISSRVRLARNIEGIPFTTKCNREDFKNVFEIMKDASFNLGYGLKFVALKDVDQLTKNSLAEKHLISQEFAKNTNPYNAILINDDESICITVNEEDHIKIQAFCSGLDLDNLMNLAIEIDEKLGNIVSYSFSEKYGFLTACPTNVGTGLKASVLVHMPGLDLTGNTRKIINVINNFGMSVRGIYGEGTNVEGDIYQISNNQTLGITEKEITKNLKLITQKIMEQERVARKYLAKKNIELEDKIYRDYGIFTNARKLSEDEAIELLSKIKMGTDLGIIEELNDKKISELFLYIRGANLQKRVGKSLTVYEQNIERAKIIKEIIK